MSARGYSAFASARGYSAFASARGYKDHVSSGVQPPADATTHAMDMTRQRTSMSPSRGCNPPITSARGYNLPAVFYLGNNCLWVKIDVMYHKTCKLEITNCLPCPCNCYMYKNNFLCHVHFWWASRYFASIAPYENFQFLKERNNKK